MILFKYFTAILLLHVLILHRLTGLEQKFTDSQSPFYNEILLQDFFISCYHLCFRNWKIPYKCFLLLISWTDLEIFMLNIVFVDSIKTGTPGSHFGSTRSKVHGNPNDEFKYGMNGFFLCIYILNM